MYSKMLFSVFILALSMNTYANDIMHPLLQVPNSKEYLMFLKNNNQMNVFLAKPHEGKISDSGIVGIYPDDQVISVFYDNNQKPSEVYVLIKRKPQIKSMKGFYYNTYTYYIDENNISVDRTNGGALSNCFDGVKLDTGIKEVCNYKDATSILSFLKKGK